jgi:hypothetical protein
MKAWTIAAVLFPLMMGTGSSSQAAEPRPGYAYWSAFKPGTMVSFDYRTKGSGADQILIKSFTLTSVSPDVATVEYRESLNAGAARARPPQPALRMRLEFRASASPKDDEDDFQAMLVTNIDKLLRDADRVAEGSESLTVKGRPISAARMRLRAGSGDVRTDFTLWTSSEIPGRLVKLVREIRAGGVTIREEVAAADFLALPASPEEIAALKSARKPEWVGVSGAQFVQDETRWFEDFESWGKEQTEFEKALSLIGPGSSNAADWSALNKQYIRQIEATSRLKSHLEEDRPKAMAKLPEADRDKLRTYFDSCDRYAGQYLKFLDSFAALATFIDDPSGAANPAAFFEDMRARTLEFESAGARAQAEYKKLMSVRLKYLR